MQAGTDIGNSGIRGGLFCAGKLLATYIGVGHIAINHLFQYSAEEVIISSGCNYGEQIGEVNRPFNKLFLINKEVPLPMNVDCLTSSSLGAERIASWYRAITQFYGPLAGVCNICDQIEKNRTILRRTISSGAQVDLPAGHNFTVNLPLLKHRKQRQYFRKSTKIGRISAAVRGAWQGLVGYLQEYKIQFPDLKVIIYAGDRFFFDKINELDIFVLPNLVLRNNTQY